METMVKGPPKNASEEELSEYLKQLCSDVTLQSREDGFFAKWLEQVKENLSGNFMQHFSKLTKDEDRIVSVWGITPLHSLKVMKFYKKKDADMSEDKRNDGNYAFQKKQHLAALSLYSQAVIKAPQNGKFLSYAHANRSAVLFHMRKYNYCLQDITLALQYGYPKELQYKIFERRGSCFQHQGKYTEAVEEFQTSLSALSEASLEKPKLESWKKTLKTKIEECKDKTDEIKRVEKDDRQPIVGGPPPKQNLYDGISPILPNASAAVGLEWAPDMGRYAVATRDIPAGQLLVSEEPYAAVLSADKSGGHCGHCSLKLTAAVACPDCAGIGFCSPKCRDSAMVYHQWECQFSDLLYASGMSLNCYLALRIITERTVKYFMELKPELDDLPLKPSVANPYRPSHYSSVYQQVGLENERDAFDFLQRTLMTVFLLKVLQRADYFGKWDNDAAPNEDLTESELMIGSLLLRNLQVIQFNAHELSTMMYYGSLISCPFKSSKTIYMGLAIYPTVAFFNHSCLPAVTRYFDGRRINIVSMRPLVKGEIIAENYGPIFTYHPIEERQKKLKSRYWFECRCIPCLEKWPNYVEMNSPPTLKCGKCGSGLPPPMIDQSKKEKVKCLSCGETCDPTALMLTLLEAQKNYKEGKRLLDLGEREQAIRQFLLYIGVTDQVICLPYKEFHLALEALRLLIAARGTSIYIDQGKK